MATSSHLEGSVVVAAYWAMFSVMTVIFVMRLWARLFFIRIALRADDFLTILVWCLLLVCISCNTYFTVNEDRYPQNVTEVFQPENYAFIVKILKMSWALVHIYYLMLMLVKMSFVFLYFQLVDRLGRIYKVVLWTMVVYIMLGFVSVELLNFLWCRPIQTNWDPLSFCTTFWSPRIFMYAFIMNVSSDVMIMFFPLFLLRSLSFQRRETIAFFFVLTIGGLSVIASCVRYSQIAAVTDNLSQRQSYGSSISLWSAVEIVAGFIACCLPTFRQFLNKINLQKLSYVSSSSLWPGSSMGSKNRTPGPGSRVITDESLLESRADVEFPPKTYQQMEMESYMDDHHHGHGQPGTRMNEHV